MQAKQHNFSMIGDRGNIGLGLATSLVTLCMLFRLPSETTFDKKWLEKGFCMSNEDTVWLNSHAMSFYACMIFAVVLRYLQVIQAEVPPLQKAMLSGAVTSIFGHGLTHLYFTFDPTEMDLRFHLSNLSKSLSITTMLIFAFGVLLQGTLPFASVKKISIMAVITTLGITILNVEPKNNNIYAIAVIFVATSLHMLSLPNEHKNTATYALYPLFQFPVLAAGIMESTGCEGLLERMGGHAVFDSILAIGYIALELVSNYLEPRKLKKL